MFVKCKLLLPRVRFLCVGDARLAIEKTSAGKNYDMTIPLFDRLTLAERREQRRKAQTRYRQKYREIVLQKKREYASRPTTLARRKYLYNLRRNAPSPPQPPSPKPVPTLDTWAKHRICATTKCQSKEACADFLCGVFRAAGSVQAVKTDRHLAFFSVRTIACFFTKISVSFCMRLLLCCFAAQEPGRP